MLTYVHNAPWGLSSVVGKTAFPSLLHFPIAFITPSTILSLFLSLSVSFSLSPCLSIFFTPTRVHTVIVLLHCSLCREAVWKHQPLVPVIMALVGGINFDPTSPLTGCEPWRLSCPDCVRARTEVTCRLLKILLLSDTSLYYAAVLWVFAPKWVNKGSKSIGRPSRRLMSSLFSSCFPHHFTTSIPFSHLPYSHVSLSFTIVHALSHLHTL